MKNVLLAITLAMLLIADPAAAVDAKIGGDQSNRVTVIGGNNGSTVSPILVDAATGRMLVSLPIPAYFYGAGITADTTTNVSDKVATQTTCCGYGDVEAAPWSTANLYRYKSIEIKINSTTGTTGSYVFRIQGSYTGQDGSWRDVLLTGASGGTAIAQVDTLQFVASGTGAPFLGGFKIPLNTFVNSTVFLMWQDPLNSYAWLRVIVLNRSNSTGAGLNYTVKWEGSQ